MGLQSNDSIRNIEKTNPTGAALPETSAQTPGGVDSGVSSIEKSKASLALLIPYSNFPLLTSPSTQQNEPSAVESIDAAGMIKVQFMKGIVMQMGEIQQNVLEGWNASLKEIEDEVRELLTSQNYLQKQDLIHKYQTQNSASGVEGASGQGAAPKEGLGIINALDNAHVMERISPTVEVKDTSAPQDSGQALILPLAMSVLIGGSFVFGMTSLGGTAATSPAANVAGLVESMQPLLPAQLSVVDIIPLINLMIAAPIYYHSWNEAVSNLTNREGRNNLAMAQNFAKDVLKMVTDPSFNMLGLIRGMPGVEKLSPDEQQRLTHILKFILIGVALSLLYSAEVGKVQGKQFGGMMPEELRDLLNGELAPQTTPEKNLSLQEQLTMSLIMHARNQLAFLSPEEKILAVTILLQYIEQSREFNPMTDPKKVFATALGSDEAPLLLQTESIKV